MRLVLFAAVLSFTVFASGCGSTKRAINFATDAPGDSVTRIEDIDREVQTVIKKDDILAINVSSISSITPETDPVRVFREGGTQFNVAAVQGGQAAGAINPGYLVDEDGFIDYPVLGKMKMAGLNIRQAKETLAQKLKLYVKEPVVEVRIINYKVVVLGDVARPGTLIAPNHKMTIVEALATAGDINITGRRENILVIREAEGRRSYARLNLNSREVFHSPYYYLQQNDIVYVEPNNVRRQASNNFTQIYLPVISTVLSTAIAVVSIIIISRRN